MSGESRERQADAASRSGQIRGGPQVEGVLSVCGGVNITVPHIPSTGIQSVSKKKEGDLPTVGQPGDTRTDGQTDKKGQQRRQKVLERQTAAAD